MVDLSLSESNDIDSIPVSYEAFCGFILGPFIKDRFCKRMSCSLGLTGPIERHPMSVTYRMWVSRGVSVHHV